MNFVTVRIGVAGCEVLERRPKPSVLDNERLAHEIRAVYAVEVRTRIRVITYKPRHYLAGLQD